MSSSVYYLSMVRELLGTKEAAARLGICPDHLRRLLEKGEVKGKKVGRDWIVFKVDYQRKRKPKRSLNYDNAK